MVWEVLHATTTQEQERHQAGRAEDHSEDATVVSLTVPNVLGEQHHNKRATTTTGGRAGTAKRVATTNPPARTRRHKSPQHTVTKNRNRKNVQGQWDPEV